MTHPAPEIRHASPTSAARGLGLALLLALWITPVDTLANSSKAPEPQHPVAGFHETVWVVRDLDPWIAALTEVAGWELVHRGAPDPRWATVWSLVEGSILEEALVRNPGTDRGWVRLTQITVAGEPSVAPQSRPHAQTWDTGGHFDVNLRAVGVDQRLDELEAHGFAAYTAPVEFTFGPFRVREVLARGPDYFSQAMPPNRGIVSLRFPVEGLDTWRASLIERGAEPSAINALVLEPQGMIRVFSLRTPEGALLEFFEPGS